MYVLHVLLGIHKYLPGLYRYGTVESAVDKNCHAAAVKDRYGPRFFGIVSAFFVDHRTCDGGPCRSRALSMAGTQRERESLFSTRSARCCN